MVDKSFANKLFLRLVSFTAYYRNSELASCKRKAVSKSNEQFTNSFNSFVLRISIFRQIGLHCVDGYMIFLHSVHRVAVRGNSSEIGRVSYIGIYLCYFCFRWKTVSLVQASMQYLMHHVTVSLQQSKITLQNNCINNTSITQPTFSCYFWLKM